MVGFVMVVAVVAVIFLVFLGIMLRKPGATEDRTEVSEVSLFLDAMLEYTTECKVSGTKLNFKDAIIEASETDICSAGVSGSLKDYLEQLARNITENSWNPGPGRPYQGYKIKALSEATGIINIEEFGISPGVTSPSPSSREYKVAEKPLGKGIVITFTLFERLD